MLALFALFFLSCGDAANVALVSSIVDNESRSFRLLRTSLCIAKSALEQRHSVTTIVFTSVRVPIDETPGLTYVTQPISGLTNESNLLRLLASLKDHDIVFYLRPEVLVLPSFAARVGSFSFSHGALRFENKMLLLDPRRFVLESADDGVYEFPFSVGLATQSPTERVYDAFIFDMILPDTLSFRQNGAWRLREKVEKDIDVVKIDANAHFYKQWSDMASSEACFSHTASESSGSGSGSDSGPNRAADTSSKGKAADSASSKDGERCGHLVARVENMERIIANLQRVLFELVSNSTEAIYALDSLVKTIKQ